MMDNLSRILSQYEWEKSESVNSFSSPWLWFLSSSIRQGSGLKIHVSAGLDCAPKAALVLNSFCREHSIAFKICRDLTYLSNLNMGFLDQSQVGKFATLYPSGDKDTPAIVSSLIPTLSKIKGPTPPADYKISGSECLSYRYGEFSTPDPRDSRRPALPVPDSIQDYLSGFRNTAVSTSLIQRGYRVIRTLSYSGRGGTFWHCPVRNLKLVQDLSF